MCMCFYENVVNKPVILLMHVQIEYKSIVTNKSN